MNSIYSIYPDKSNSRENGLVQLTIPGPTQSIITGCQGDRSLKELVISHPVKSTAQWINECMPLFMVTKCAALNDDAKSPRCVSLQKRVTSCKILVRNHFCSHPSGFHLYHTIGVSAASPTSISIILFFFFF